ncbi:1515_t:CDS:10 [Entrophospora sp. SA101]|nr:1515_t:CDS:10 [Entrophospora sp. SA101]CAJ0848231.1 833_t:CDS:10 [Entrophospora sp. SA101]CAJ0848260.1 838_t:CDS:10 [Entrophospora sp. SA101]CAJ0848284.1 842_t:CDS:10 [Entrophospora sp. SA101]CAJ0894682.1 5922_t:CDS:10 [Entrophospora sp. SA101]
MGSLPLFNQWFIWLFALTTWIICVNADSYSSNPLTYLEFVSDPSIDILPRNRFESHNQEYLIQDLDDKSLRHDDSMRIRFIAFNRTFNLHLEPHYDLLHPEATITIHHADDTSTTTRLLLDDHRLYKGYLLDVKFTDKRLTEDMIGLKRKSLSEELFGSVGVLGWASIHVHDDGSRSNRKPIFEGAFSYNNDIYHIKTIENFKITRFRDDPAIPNLSARHINHRYATMVIFRDSDIKNSDHNRRSLTDENVQTCGSDDILGIKTNRNDHLLTHTDENSNPLSPWWKRLDFSSNIKGNLDVSYHSNSNNLFKRGASGCPDARKVAYMGAAADCTYVTSYKSSDAARKQILTDWGTASAVYERTFNVTLGLIKIDIRDAACPATPDSAVLWNRDCSDSYSINTRLSDFSLWRGKLTNDTDTALWHLMSKCNTGSKVGVAWLGQLCTITANSQTTEQGTAYVSGTGVSTIVKDEWKVVAHEIGHGFGASHDCIAANCPCTSAAQCNCCPLSSTVCDAGGKYIMNPTSNVLTNDFSMLLSIGTCLKDPSDTNSKILSQAMCGNGLKEDGEECDCGTDCQNDQCCDGTTCKFKPGAVCADSNDLCCLNCKYKTAGIVCRPPTSNCDISEVCTGTSGDCPVDKHIDDGTTCGTNLECAGGICTSRDAQCNVRGSKMGITKACSSVESTSCVISCLNPNDTRSCLEMSGYFVDGTPCGLAGRCNKGQFQAIGSWIAKNLKIVIPRRLAKNKLSISSTDSSRYLYSPVNPSHTTANLSRSNRIATGDNTPTPSGWVDPTPYNGPKSPPETHRNVPASSQPRERIVPMPDPYHYNRSTDRSVSPRQMYDNTRSASPRQMYDNTRSASPRQIQDNQSPLSGNNRRQNSPHQMQINTRTNQPPSSHQLNPRTNQPIPRQDNQSPILSPSGSNRGHNSPPIQRQDNHSPIFSVSGNNNRGYNQPDRNEPYNNDQSR